MQRYISSLSQIARHHVYYSVLRSFTMKFSKEHEWVKLDQDVATIGITHHAQSELGEIVHIELPKNKTTFKAGDSMGTVESVKTVADIFAPIDGTVLTSNVELSKKPSLMNTSPLKEGWYTKLKVDIEKVKKTIDALMTEEQYAKFLAESK